MLTFRGLLIFGSVVFATLTLALPVMAEPTFDRIDLEQFAAVVASEVDAKATPEVLAYQRRGTTHYVAIERPAEAGLTEAYVLVCDETGRVLRTLPTDEHFGTWQFLWLGEGREGVVISGGGGAHIYEHLWIYALGRDDVPEALLFEAQAAAVAVELQGETLTVTRSFDRMGGGPTAAKNVYIWNGGQFVFDATLSNWPEEPHDMVMVWERNDR